MYILVSIQEQDGTFHLTVDLASTQFVPASQTVIVTLHTLLGMYLHSLRRSDLKMIP